jgi:D-hydroxyproline dehydrogenase subunit beta
VARVVIIGAGIVGAACAYFCARRGLTVTVLDRTAVAAGTTGGGEGNVLLSDKAPGPELTMALRSARLWLELAGSLGADTLELEHKGGLVVAATAAALAALHAFADEQRHAGIDSERLDPAALRTAEPHLARDLAGGVFYPADLQVQPMLAAARLLAESGAGLRLGCEAVGLRLDHEQVTGVRTSDGVIPADYVVNAAGAWGSRLGERFDAPVPVLPRRGFVLVTEPLPPLIRHKVYTADYVANVASDDAALQTSSVIEGTRAGTVLIGASRERVGFDKTTAIPVVRQLAAQAVRVFPVLAGVNLIRVYAGFRPYCPDHLPIVGPDPRVPGLLHACGHEGAGIGLAPATGELIAALIAGAEPSIDPAPFAPDRLVGAPL